LPVDINKYIIIIFYNLLLLDNTLCIRESYNKWYQRLRTLVEYIIGRVDITSCKIIDFLFSNTPEVLGKVFVQAIVQQWEGLVLKGCDDPYFLLNSTKVFIKLKKDYIAGLEDTADFAIVSRHCNTRDKQELGIGKL
jgi:DNA ligase 4